MVLATASDRRVAAARGCADQVLPLIGSAASVALLQVREKRLLADRQETSRGCSVGSDANSRGRAGGTAVAAGERIASV